MGGFEENQRKLAENSALSKMLLSPAVRAFWPDWWYAGGAGIACSSVTRGNHREGLGTVASAMRLTTARMRAKACRAIARLFVVERLLQAVSPASLELSLAAIKDVELERKELHDHWQQRLARSRYEVEQARRQYAAVDPEHRLVARVRSPLGRSALRGRTVIGRLHPLPAGVPDATFVAGARADSGCLRICRLSGTPTRPRRRIVKRSRDCC